MISRERGDEKATEASDAVLYKIDVPANRFESFIPYSTVQDEIFDRNFYFGALLESIIHVLYSYCRAGCHWNLRSCGFKSLFGVTTVDINSFKYLILM